LVADRAALALAGFFASTRNALRNPRDASAGPMYL